MNSEKGRVAIINYGAGNIRSVANAISKLGYTPLITDNPQEVLESQAVILPGVGAAADTMAGLEKAGMLAVVRKLAAEDKPLFAVCVGLQVLLSETEENGGSSCMGIVPGVVKRLPTGLKIPHMGWNQVKQTKELPLFEGIPDGANFYFVHSYYAQPEDESLVAGVTEYGTSLCSVLVRGNLVATQFHPEKSGRHGLKMYENFLKMAFGGKR